MTGILGQSAQDEAAFEDFVNDAACPALDPASGLCELYDARPMTCRVFGPPVRVESGEAKDSFSVCELCFTEASPDEIARCEMAVPNDEEQRLAEQVEAALKETGDRAAGETIVAYCLIDSPTAPIAS